MIDLTILGLVVAFLAGFLFAILLVIIWVEILQEYRKQ